MELKLKIEKVEVIPKIRKDARYVDQRFPFWFCRLVNWITKRKLIGKYRLSDWTIEEYTDIEIFHSVDLEKELVEALTKEANRNDQ